MGTGGRSVEPGADSPLTMGAGEVKASGSGSGAPSTQLDRIEGKLDDTLELFGNFNRGVQGDMEQVHGGIVKLAEGIGNLFKMLSVVIFKACDPDRSGHRGGRRSRRKRKKEGKRTRKRKH